MKNKIIRFFENHIIFIFILAIVIQIIYLRNSKGIVQQDNYLEYAKGLSTNFETISYFNSRLYAGLPILIIIAEKFINNWQIAGYFIILVFFVINYILLYKLTLSKFAFIPLIFPPVILNQATKISTEMPTLFLLLMSVFYLKKEKENILALLIGLSVWLRHNIIVVLVPTIWKTLNKGQYLKLIKLVLIFFVPIFMYGLFNMYYLKTRNPIYPYSTYLDVSRQRWGFGPIQLYKDAFRAYSWGQYRILFSGSFYMVFLITSFLYVKRYLKENNDEYYNHLFLIALFIAIFAILLGHEPFLEEYPRYLIGVFPLLWLIIHKKFESLYLGLLLFIISSIVVIL